MLTISKPLTAGQAQTYHKKEFTSKEQSYWARGQEVQGEWQGQLAEKYGLAGPVGNERRINIRTPTAKPSRQWSIAPDGMRLFLHPNLFHLQRWSAAMSVSAKPTAKVFERRWMSWNGTRKPESAAIIQQKRPVDSLWPNSSMTRLVLWTDMPRRSSTLMP